MNANSSPRWVVDAIDEKMATIEVDGLPLFHVPVAVLPHGVKDGDVLHVSIAVDAGATRAALDASAAQVKRGRDASAKRDPGGDIAL